MYSLIIFILQWYWVDGSPVGKLSWISKAANINSVRNTLEIMPLFVFYFTELLARYERVTGRVANRALYRDYRSLNSRIITDASQILMKHSMENITEQLLSKLHPIQGRNCTLAMINPLNGLIEWLSVDCRTRFDISTLICERSVYNGVSNDINTNAKPKQTVANAKTTIVYADMTNYFDYVIRDTQLTRRCPAGWSLVITCNSTNSMVLSAINYKEQRPFSITAETPQWMRILHKRQCYDKHYYKSQSGYSTLLPGGSYFQKEMIHFVVCPFQLNRVIDISAEITRSAAITRKKNVIQASNFLCAKFNVQIRDYCIIPNAKNPLVDIDKWDKISALVLIAETLFHYGICEITSKGVIHSAHNASKKCDEKHVFDLTVSLPISWPKDHEAQCPPGLFKCGDGHCVSPSVIDGTIPVCPDGSDVTTESVTSLTCMPPTCHCGPHYYHCPSGGCILWDKVANGAAHCTEGEDETLMERIDIGDSREVATEKTFHCLNGTYIPEVWLNDLIPDCLHGDDEPPPKLYIENTNCNRVGQLQCSPGHPRCFPFHALCIFDFDHFGHLQHCRNGAHLSHCLNIQCSGLFKCPQSYCLPARRLCDDTQDCPGGEDEHGCTDESMLCPGFLKCKSTENGESEAKSQLCVHPLQHCDGQEDCPHGDDEHLCDVAPCPYDCHCLSLSMVCLHNSPVDTFLYRAVSQVSVGLHTLDLLNSSSVLFLNISHNDIAKFDLDAFRDLQRLVTLDISYNQIYQIKSFTFEGLRWLIFLNLEKNSIAQIEFDAFTGLKSLPLLDLSRQRLSSVRINLVELDKLLVLNLSENQLSEVINLKDRGALLQTVDMRGNPLKTVGGAHIKSETRILTDFNYLCCLGSQFICEKDKPKSLCSWATSPSIQSLSIIINVLIFVLNVTFTIIIKVTLGMNSGMVILLILAGNNIIMALSGLMGQLKDSLFHPFSVHTEGGGRHIWCVASSSLQMYTFHTSYIMFALYAMIKYVNTSRLAKETKKQFVMVLALAGTLILTSFLLSIVPSLVSTIRHQKLPEVAMTCSFLPTGNVDIVMRSIGWVVFVTSLSCIVLSIGFNIRLFKVILKTTGLVTAMGGHVSGRKASTHVVDLIYNLVISGWYITLCVVGILALFGVFGDDTIERLNLYVFPLAGILPTLRPVYKQIKSKCSNL